MKEVFMNVPIENRLKNKAKKLAKKNKISLKSWVISLIKNEVYNSEKTNK
jgi:predicted HicB family RNase H-like nuclease